MRGSLRQDRPGSWQLRVYAGSDPVTAKRRWVVRRIKGTKREAERALRALAAEVDAGQHKGTEGTVAHLLEAWYDHASPGWSPTTRQEVRLVVRRRLVPALGSLRLSELRPGHLDGLYRAMTADGLSPATVRKAHNAMSRALRQAVRWRWVPQSVAASASPPPVRQAPIVPPSPAVVTQLIEAAEGLGRTDLAVLVRLAASTGARRGELCGLRWSDIDDRAATLTVRRSVVTGEGYAAIVKGTKTHQDRRIALGPAALAAVGSLRTLAAERAAAAEEVLVADPWLFSTALDGGEPWRPDLASNHWRWLCRKAGVRARFHDLRHFAATELLDGGVPLRTVAGRLGHRRTSTTADLYAAWLPATDREAADLLEARMAGSTS